MIVNEIGDKCPSNDYAKWITKETKVFFLFEIELKCSWVHT